MPSPRFFQEADGKALTPDDLRAGIFANMKGIMINHYRALQLILSGGAGTKESKEDKSEDAFADIDRELEAQDKLRRDALEQYFEKILVADSSELPQYIDRFYWKLWEIASCDKQCKWIWGKAEGVDDDSLFKCRDLLELFSGVEAGAVIDDGNGVDVLAERMSVNERIFDYGENEHTYREVEVVFNPNTGVKSPEKVSFGYPFVLKRVMSNSDPKEFLRRREVQIESLKEQVKFWKKELELQGKEEEQQKNQGPDKAVHKQEYWQGCRKEFENREKEILDKLKKLEESNPAATQIQCLQIELKRIEAIFKDSQREFELCQTAVNQWNGSKELGQVPRESVLADQGTCKSPDPI